MYKTTVPIFNRSVTEKTRDVYLRQFKEAKINRVLLCVFGYGTDSSSDKMLSQSLTENIEFFKSHGIDAGVWIGYTIGHGCELAFDEDLVPDRSKFTPMVDLAGQTVEYALCPLDKSFRERIVQYVSTIAASGADLVLLDDDFRMSQHGPHFCCACDLHMARIRELCGEDVSREELRELAFSKKANKYRRAWMTAQKEGLELLAADIRAAVDKAAPFVRVGLCASHAVCGVDGTDPVTLSRILAGKNTVPFMRTHGAPYWHIVRKRPISTVIEEARHFASFCKDSGVEIISEGDTYPRPRYMVPSSLLEMYDAALRIDGGHDGILKYMVDYNASAEFETSYLEKHTRGLPLMNELEELFRGKAMQGVNVSCRRDVFGDADLEMGVSGLYPYPCAGAMMSLSSIPTVYGDGGTCRAVFGEEARHIDLSEIKNGAILDGIAAKILTDRGIDVGISGDVTFTKESSTFLADPEKREKAYVSPSELRYARVKISDAATTALRIYFENETYPLAYKYQNKDGARFLVYLFDAMALNRGTGLYRGYLQQKVLKDGIEWLSGAQLPAFIEKAPELYVMCGGKDKKMAVALFNFFADSIDQPVITLDKEYKNIRFVNCSGQLKGNKVILDTPIHAFTVAAFEVC